MTMRQHWQLDPNVIFLNHGSFGATPTAVLAYQSALRERLERQPVALLGREVEPLLAEARQQLAPFLGADANDLAFVTNATTGVNTILHSFPLQPGDELLTTQHAYNACKNALEAAAARAGASVVVAHVPFPLTGPNDILEPILNAVTPRTRLALIDHVTSPTAIIFPVEQIVRELAARGVETLVDGAHAPGMLPLNLNALGAAFYTGNGHKWPCAPKGAAFLHVRKDWQERIRPLVISHGATRPLAPGETRFTAEFGWQGTFDPTPYLSLPEAIRYVGSLHPDGWDGIRASNHQKAVAMRAMLLQRLNLPAPCPEAMLGSMATIPLPIAPSGLHPSARDPLQAALLDRYRIEIPVMAVGPNGERAIRISAHLYNTEAEYHALADALAALI